MAVEQRAATARAAPVLTETVLLRTWRRFRKHRLGMLGLVMLSLMVLGIVAIPVLSPFSYKAQNIFQPFAPAGTVTVDAGDNIKAGSVYLLGSDDFGRDVFTRLFFAGRITLTVALISTLIVVLVGALLGGLAGYFGGRIDALYVGLTDFVLAFPVLPTLLMLAKIFPVGPQFSNADGEFYQTIEQAVSSTLGYSLVFVAFSWVPLSRQVRAALMHTRTLDYIEAARAFGAGGWRILTRHLMPNSADVILLSAVLTAGQVIVFESLLSYMGLGVIQPVPTWGNMIRDAQEQVWNITSTLDPTQNIRGFLLILPGLMILLAVVSINFIADGLRDALSAR